MTLSILITESGFSLNSNEFSVYYYFFSLLFSFFLRVSPLLLSKKDPREEGEGRVKGV